MRTLEELIKELPPELQKEVHDFVKFLLEKRMRNTAEHCVRIGLVRSGITGINILH